ncbi:MAG: polyphenol oxidase family protein [Oligoflexus sp.]
MMRKYLEHVFWFSAQPQTWNRHQADQAFGFRGIAADTLPVFHFPKQVHGTRIIEADARTASDLAVELPRPEADGIFTQKAGEIVAVQTADCLPVLFTHTDFAMAVHAGWRGLADGILVQAAETLQRLNIQPQEVSVVLGPAIGLAAFEVGPEVVDHFRDYFSDIAPQALSWALMKGQTDRWHIDLATAACLSLQALGFAADKLSCYRVCTKSTPQEWHSYRRDGQKAGRNWSWVGLSS